MNTYDENPIARVGPDELTGLLAAVQEATGKLESSHTQLLARVDALTRDLTEANSQLERAGRLAALGEMAAGIAHEIRNPLGCVRLYASLLTQDLKDRPEAARLAEKITDATRAMEGIVADVLTFAREFRLRPEPVDPADLLASSLAQASHDGVPGWRTVRITGPRGDGEPVECDRALVVQALTNIIRNAFEAMGETAAPPEGHELTLESRTATVATGTGRAGSGVRCTVFRITDTGPGVSDDVAARMFNPFFTTRHTGTGLGLAIVHRIADAHGGRITISNAKARRGACAELTLPLRAADGARHPISPPRRDRAANPTEQAA